MITPCDVIGIVDVRVCAQLSFIAFLCTGHQADSLSWALIGHLLGNDVILRGEQYWSMRLYISDYSWYCVCAAVLCACTHARAPLSTPSCVGRQWCYCRRQWLLLFRLFINKSPQMHHNLIYSRFLWTDDFIHNEGPECASFALFIYFILHRIQKTLSCQAHNSCTQGTCSSGSLKGKVKTLSRLLKRKMRC